MYYIKNIIKSAVSKAIAWEPVLKNWRKIKLHDGIVALMYHEIAEDTDAIESWTVVKKSDFVNQMKYLCDNFNVVSLGEAFQYQYIENTVRQPTAVITFDDGYTGNKDILLPIIESLNIPVTIFISTGAVQGQSLYWYDRLINALQGEQIRQINLQHIALGNYRINRFKGAKNWMELQRLLKDLKTLEPLLRESVVRDIVHEHGSKNADYFRPKPLTIKDVGKLAAGPLVTIGAHSHCHNILTQLTERDLEKSIHTSKKLLETWTGREVEYFAYPNGDFNDMVINKLAVIGFTCGLTTISRPWKKEDSFFTIPRIGIGRYDSLDNFKIRVSGGLVSCTK